MPRNRSGPRASSSQRAEAVDVVSDEEEEEVEVGKSRRGTRDEKSGALIDGGYGSLGESQQDELVKRLIRLMICRNSRKKPVRRDEITKHIFANMGNIRSKANVFRGVFLAAQQKMRTVFGMEMVLVEKLVRTGRGGTATGRSQMTQSQAQSGGSGMKGYILVSILAPELRAEDVHGKAEIGFMMVVAGMIALEASCRMEQEQLYRLLERLGCHVWEKGGHKQLNGGNVKELLERTLVSQWYLEREKEDQTFYYTIGPRFWGEVEDDDLIEFIDAVYGLGGDNFSLDDVSKNELKLKLQHARGEGLDDGYVDEMEVDE